MSNRDWELERTIARCSMQVYGRYLVWLVLVFVVVSIGKVSL
jgi:TRAP-type mannitol/chloroaromatic compound transport system permease small subunit